MAADGMVEDGPPLTELESLQLKANNITDESLESTRRMITLCEESQNTGAKTIAMLEHQGEQLNRIENDMETMNNEMKEAEKHITGMEKWCGLCVCPWNRAAKVRDVDGTWSKSNGDKKGSEPVSQQPRPGGSNVPDSGSGPYIRRINNDAREDEMEENMQAVGSVLSNLKNMAQDMGSEISKQNKQLDRITNKAETVDTRIQVANKRTEKLLK